MAIDINIPSQVKTFANLAAFPVTGAAKTIYIAEDTNKTYRWTGSVYVEISASAAGSSTWGSITGTLSSQTDLQSALNSKVSNVTASAPLQSSGGTTPDVSITQANVSTDGYLSSADWTTFNGKQANLISGVNIKTVNSQSILGIGQVTVQDTLVSGTNIKTINGNSVLGSGDLVVSGGGGLQGVHALLPIASGSIVPIVVNGTGITTVASITNRLYAIPFIPNKTFTSSNLYLNVTVLGSGVNGRILIYSDLNGKPDTKIFESSNLDCSTTGLKTATTSQTFTAGTTYWICTHFSGICTTHAYSVASLMNIYGSGTSISCSYYNTPSFGSAPSPFGTPFVAGANLPAVFITAV